MSVIPGLTSRLERLHAAASLLALAAKLLPKIVSLGSAETIASQIMLLQKEVAQQIETVEESFEKIEDRLATIGQFLLLNRTHLSAQEIEELDRLLASVRGPSA